MQDEIGGSSMSAIKLSYDAVSHFKAPHPGIEVDSDNFNGDFNGNLTNAAMSMNVAVINVVFIQCLIIISCVLK